MILDKWIPEVIVGYLIFIFFVIFVVSNINFNVTAFDLTTEQEAVLESRDIDAVTIISKLFILGSINSTFAFIDFILFILTVVFIFALGKALKELIPALPS